MKQEQVDALGRQLQALELRKAGVSYQKIADALGYAHASGAHKAVESALKRTLQDPADEVRRLEVERLDAALFALWPSVTKGQYKAVEVALRLMERRAKLLGLDAPTKTDVNNTGTQRVIIEYGNGQTAEPTPGATTDQEREEAPERD
jgi:hypothetical protein